MRFSHLRSTIGLVALGFLSVSPLSAHAQQAVTGTTDAGRIEQQLMRTTPRPQVSERIEVKPAAPDQMPEGAGSMAFVLGNIGVDGMTIYKDSDIASLYAGKIGQTITLADVYAMAADLTAKYRNDGYVLTQVIVPAQTIDGGSVRLQAVEGFINNLAIQGELSETELSLVNAYAAQAKSDGPANIRDLEQALLLINELPGLNARSVISPAKDVVGGADLDIVIERDPYDLQLGFDTYGSPYLGVAQMSAVGSLNSVFGLGEKITTELSYAPGPGFVKELAYGSLSYEQPLGPWGTKFTLLGSHGSTEPGDSLIDFDIKGASTLFSARVDQPVIKTRDLGFSLHALLDSRNSVTKSNLEPTRTDNVRSLRAGADLTFTDSIFKTAYNALGVEVSHGIDIFGASDKGDANLSRADGDPNYTKIQMDYERLQHIYRGFSLLFGAKGQYSNSILLSGEEFGVGGATIGRGYDPSEIVGDKGVSGKLELQWNPAVAAPFVSSLQFYTFMDAGRVWNKDATTAADERISLVSTGIGFRTSLAWGTDVEMFMAMPMNRDVDSRDSQTPRTAFKLVQGF